MQRIKTPTNQKLLTNVAVVRTKKAGKRFEVACFKNKVLSWRQGVEKDIDEVLQSHTVFSNVSKGQVAKKDDLTSAFGTDDQTAICREILDKGELQVSDKERQAHQEALFKDVATIVGDNCINPDTRLPYPVSMIEKAMRECHIAIKPGKGAKQQAMETVTKLKAHMPIERARMRVRLAVPNDRAKPVMASLKRMSSSNPAAGQTAAQKGPSGKSKAAAAPKEPRSDQDPPQPPGGAITTEAEDKDEDTTVLVLLIDPGQYRPLDEMVRKETQGKGLLEILDVKEIPNGGFGAEGVS